MNGRQKQKAALNAVAEKKRQQLDLVSQQLKEAIETVELELETIRNGTVACRVALIAAGKVKNEEKVAMALRADEIRRSSIQVNTFKIGGLL